MTDENAGGPGSIKGGLTFNVGYTYDPEGRKAKPKSIEHELHGEGLLGEHLGEKRGGALSAKFVVPPFSSLNAREGWWQDRKRAWLALGIQSELGRGSDITWGDSPEITQQGLNFYREKEKGRAPNATPGGSLLPAMDYSKRQRGDGKGRAIEAQEPAKAAHKPTKPAAPAKPAAGPRKLALPTITSTAETPAKAPAAARQRMVQSAPLALPASHWRAPAEFPRLGGARRIGIDTEGCDPDLKSKGPGVRRGAFIAGLSVARDDGSKWYFPVAHEGGDNMDPDSVWSWARAELNAFDGEVVGAHLIYDLDMLAEKGITFPKVKRFRDIQISEPLLNEHRFNYQLGTLSKDYLNRGKNDALLREAAAAYGWTSEDDIKSNLWRLPARFVGAYAQDDAGDPLAILALQEPKLVAEELTELFDLESRLIPVLLAMRRRGVRVNLKKAEYARDLLDRERAKWLGVVRSFAGPSAELMAPESFVAALEERGIRVARTARNRQPSINDAFFEEYHGDPLVDAIANGRRVQTLIGTFIDGTVFGNQIKGRIHAQFHQMKGDEGGAKTGRFSSSNPNLQNIPSRQNEDVDDQLELGDTDIVKLIRGIFEPEEGEEWERHDLSQIEYRYLVHFAVGRGAEEARQAYRDDPLADFHKMCARMARMDPDNKQVRKRVKNLNFCKVYGGGKAKVAAQMKCSLEEAEDFINTYDTELPFVKETLSAASSWAAKHGFVRTILNRRQRFILWEPSSYNDRRTALPHDRALAEYGHGIKRSKVYAGLNYKLQGSAADHIKKALVDTWESGVCAIVGAPLLTVHDENDWSKPRTQQAIEAMAEAKRLLENAITLHVPVIADADTGADWGVTS